MTNQKKDLLKLSKRDLTRMGIETDQTPFYKDKFLLGLLMAALVIIAVIVCFPYLAS